MKASIFKPGETYTLIRISIHLAYSYSQCIEIQKIANGMVVYKEIVNGVKRAQPITLAIDNPLVFSGTQIPFRTDYDLVYAGKSNVFEGNGLFNLLGELPIEEVRRFIEEYNLNTEAELGDVIYKDVPVFPELADEAVLALTGFPQANAPGI